MVRFVGKRASGSSIGVFAVAWGAIFVALCPTVPRAAELTVSTVARVTAAGQLPSDSRLGPLKDKDGYFPFTPPKSAEEWEERAERMRRQVLVANGLWPMPEKTPLHAVVYGRVERDGYTVDKVYFESYPGHFVTGNLYRPKEHAETIPGVLCPYGHWPGGRFNEETEAAAQTQIDAEAEKHIASARHFVQAYPAQLARMGCVAFQYDMEGYCDSVQIPMQVAHQHAQWRPGMDTPHDWGFFSAPADLRLESIMGLQTYNSIRALDFLCELPEVDPKRLAVTGASSGGTQTLMVCAADPRVSVAVPVVMVSTAMQGGCVCENCELLRLGAGNVDFAALFAPKPLAAIGANDWTKEIETKGGPELQELYTLLGAKDNVLVKKFDFPHNYNYVSRSEMYQWMNKQLKLGLKEPVVEEDFVPLSRAEMTVWDQKHPRPRGGEDYERELVQIMTEDSQRQLEKLAATDEKSLANFRHIVGGAWQIIIDRGISKPGDVEFQQISGTIKPERENFIGKKGLLRYKPEQEEIPAIVLMPKGETRRTAIWLDPTGKAALFGADGLPRPAIRKLLDAGIQVVGLDLLYQGEFLSNGKPLLYTRKVVTKGHESAAYTFGYNRALFAQRVHDVLSAVSYFRGDDQPWGVVDIVGLNGAGRWAVAAKAIAGDAVDRTVIDTAGFRFAGVTSTDHPDFLPGSVKYFDIPGLLALCAPSEILVSGEGTGKNRSEIITATYKAAGASDKVTWYEGLPADLENAAVRWLSRK
jgi:hypothetical protein